MLLAVLTALFMGLGFLIGGESGMIAAFFIAAAMNLFSFWNSDKMVLRMNNAVEVDESNAPEFYRMVAHLAERANLPMPKVYIIDQPQPNAFATGRNPQNAAVAATTGLLNTLTPDEVAGVMAHELAHIENRDTLIMTIAATIAGAISMLGNFAFFFGRSRDSNSPLGGIGALVALIVAPFAAMLIQMAVSRTREYSADKRGGEIAGNPLALASALRKIAGGAQRIRNPAAEANPAMAHMYIANPLHGEGADNLFSTHPNMENRVRALEEQGRAYGSVEQTQAQPRQPLPQQDQEGPWSQSGPSQADDPESEQRSGPWNSAPAPEPPRPQKRGPWGRNPDRNDRWS